MLGTESRVLGPQTRATPKGGTGVNGGLRPQAVRLTPAWPGNQCLCPVAPRSSSLHPGPCVGPVRSGGGLLEGLDESWGLR